MVEQCGKLRLAKKLSPYYIQIDQRYITLVDSQGGDWTKGRANLREMTMENLPRWTK